MPRLVKNRNNTQTVTRRSDNEFQFAKTAPLRSEFEGPSNEFEPAKSGSNRLPVD